MTSYEGRVAIDDGPEPVATINDLDRDDWIGTLEGGPPLELSGGAVRVTLRDGDRAGESAFAQFATGADHKTHYLNGRVAFGHE